MVKEQLHQKMTTISLITSGFALCLLQLCCVWFLRDINNFFFFFFRSSNIIILFNSNVQVSVQLASCAKGDAYANLTYLQQYIENDLIMAELDDSRQYYDRIKVYKYMNATFFNKTFYASIDSISSIV